MGNLDDAIKELQAINAHLAEISANLQQRDRKSDESLNVIRKDLWNIKNIVADEGIQNRIVQKGVERALAKGFGYLLISAVMLYIIGKFFLWIRQYRLGIIGQESSITAWFDSQTLALSSNRLERTASARSLAFRSY